MTSWVLKMLCEEAAAQERDRLNMALQDAAKNSRQQEFAAQQGAESLRQALRSFLTRDLFMGVHGFLSSW